MPTIRSNGIELEYDEVGEGEPLLLIMGLGAQMIFWDEEFCAQLAARGFRVIRFDNRDIGRSTWLDELGMPAFRTLLWRRYAGLSVDTPYSLNDMADDAVGLLDGLGIEQAHVVGASMGGMIAQLMAIHHPARVRTLVSIMSTPGNRRYSIAKPEALRALLGKLPATREERIENSVRIHRVLNGGVLPFDADATRERATRAYARGFHPAGFVRQFTAILAAPHRLQELSQLSVPTTVLHGTRDPLVPPGAGAATARAIPNARLQWLADMGHTLPRPLWPQIHDAIAHNAQRAATL